MWLLPNIWMPILFASRSIERASDVDQSVHDRNSANFVVGVWMHWPCWWKTVFYWTYFPKKTGSKCYIILTRYTESSLRHDWPNPKVTEGVKKCWKCFFVEGNVIASITVEFYFFKKWEPRIDFDKGGGHSAPKFRCRPAGDTYYNTTISLVTWSYARRLPPR
jgi:hypothetical protein